MIDLSVFHERHRSIIERAMEIARECNLAIYLVGGPVRDLLLGRATEDVDLMAGAGDIDEIAHRFATQPGLCVERHDRFLTRKLLFPGGEIVDLATMRSETYEKPGALPVVAQGSLEEDMRRRDFTINAMAIDLRSMNVVDPFGGLDDLERQRLRVLHDASFRDDPTRIVRAARFVARLGFTLDDATHRLASEAIGNGATETLSRERLWREVLRLIGEPNAGTGFAFMAGVGFTRAFFGAEGIDPLRLNRLLLSPVLTTAEREQAALATLVSTEAALDGSPFRRGERETIMRSGSMKNAVEGTAEQIAHAIVSGKSIEQAVAASLERDRFRRFEEIVVRVTTARAAMPQRLDVPPGPHVGKALRETHVALALGEIPVPEAASFARRKALEYLHPGPRHPHDE